MCIFCKIIHKDIPSTIVYEDEDVLAILDISQVTKGHTLIMPKVHVEDVLVCPSVLYSKMSCVAQDLAKLMITKLGASGVNILTNAKEVAGQTIPHFHIHIIPRYNESDGFYVQFKANPDVDVKEVREKLTSK